MATIIDGKAIAAAVRADVAADVAALKEKGIVPGLAVIIVGSDPASRVYVNNKKRPAPRRGFIRRNSPCRRTPPRTNCSRWWKA